MSRYRFRDCDATPEGVYADRREILKALGLGTLSLATASACSVAAESAAPDRARISEPAVGAKFADLFPADRSGGYGLGDDRALTPEPIAAAYNNFYEFTTDKERVWELAQGYAVDPWKVRVSGLVKKKQALSLQDVFRRLPLEERLYRFRCVERWSMQVPWTGFPLRRLIDELQPLGSARYVRFVSLDDRKMPGVKAAPWYPWPYFEGLRLDEAGHDLAFVAVGIYGHALPMQHGAPWRIIAPWKYGYKSPKSIAAIEFTEHEPETFWHKTIPDEYGFFSNVDPGRPHPRWSQAQETDIGTGAKRATLLYNGYADEVGSLYRGGEF